MEITTYDFSKYERVFVPNGNDGLSTIDKEKLEDYSNRVLVVGQDGNCRIEWELDGTAYTEFYAMSSEHGLPYRIKPEKATILSCCVHNPKSQTVRTFGVNLVDGVLKSTNKLPFVLDERQCLTQQEVVIPPGRYYPMYSKPTCDYFLVKEMEIYESEEQAAWFSAPTIDKVKGSPRSELVSVEDSVLNALKRSFAEFKTLAEANNIRLFVDEYSGEIHAAKVPEGHDIEFKEGDTAGMIPWVLMPAIGKCHNTVNCNLEFQPTLVNIAKQ